MAKRLTKKEQERQTAYGRAHATYDAIAKASSLLRKLDNEQYEAIMRGDGCAAVGREQIREISRQVEQMATLFSSIATDIALGYTEDEAQFRHQIRMECREDGLSLEAERAALARVSKDGVYPEGQVS